MRLKLSLILFGIVTSLLVGCILFWPQSSSGAINSEPANYRSARQHRILTQKPSTTTTTTTIRATTTTRRFQAPPTIHTTISQKPIVPSVLPSNMRGAILHCISSYEGGYNTDTGNGFFWAYQFDSGTWNSNAAASGFGKYVGWAVRGHTPPPASAQDAVAWHTYGARGLQPWPTPNKYCHPPSPLPKERNPAFH